MTLQIGDPAPDFELPATTGERVRLSALRGSKVLLAFYPFSFTGICTGEMCEIRDHAMDFTKVDAVTLGISCDPPPSQAVFAQQEGFEFPLLSDFWPHGEVARAYGVFVEHVGAANRGTFIIDSDGILRWSVVTELGKARDTKDYITALENIT